MDLEIKINPTEDLLTRQLNSTPFQAIHRRSASRERQAHCNDTCPVQSNR
jgi:hypothetical protein